MWKKVFFSVAPSIVVSIGLLAGTPAAYAQKSTTAALPSGAVAVVNGTSISQASFDRVLKQRLFRGQKDTPELRQSVKDELITREILAQEASKAGIDKGAEAQAQISQARQTILIDLLVAENAAKNPVTDADIKKEYDRQLALLGEPGQILEYRVRIAVLPTDAEAKTVLARIRKGESFEKVAKEKSTDRSKDQGGLLDWMLPNQMLSSVSNVVVNLTKGSVSAVPIRTPAGWTVLKVEDTRQFKPPSLEESKARIQTALTQQRRAEFIRGLRSAAKIVQ